MDKCGYKIARGFTPGVGKLGDELGYYANDIRVPAISIITDFIGAYHRLLNRITVAH
jgi:hypothetical protein